MSSDPARKPWSDADKKLLISYWEVIGSIVIISMLLQRSPSSVQTEASRIGLPRRQENKDRHRRKWTNADEMKLWQTYDSLVMPNGKIPIETLAGKMERSIDAIVAKLFEKFGDNQEDLRYRLILPSTAEIMHRAKTAAAVNVEETDLHSSAGKDTRKTKKQRNCLRCTKTFFSDGAHNRVCKKCKHEDGSMDFDF